jgi:F-type H+-transporting ATPase subunit epsilon
MTLQVMLAVPEGEVWSGPAALVIAKTLDGDIGVLTGHSPVLGILVDGSVVRILHSYGSAGPDTGDQDTADHGGELGAGEVAAAVSGGFFSVADDRVSILAREAQLGTLVDQPATRAALEEALQAAAATGDEEGEEPADVQYLRALLKAAGDPDASS